MMKRVYYQFIASTDIEQLEKNKANSSRANIHFPSISYASYAPSSQISSALTECPMLTYYEIHKKWFGLKEDVYIKYFLNDGGKWFLYPSFQELDAAHDSLLITMLDRKYNQVLKQEQYRKAIEIEKVQIK